MVTKHPSRIGLTLDVKLYSTVVTDNKELQTDTMRREKCNSDMVTASAKLSLV